MKILENSSIKGFVFVLIGSFTLSSVANCGKVTGSTVKDPRIMVVVEEALADLKKQGAVDVSAAYGIDSFEFQTQTNPASLGRCNYQYSTFHAESHITVDPVFWNNKLNQRGKKVVLIHEMLHCAWNVYDHTESGIMAKSTDVVIAEDEYQTLVEEAVTIINSRKVDPTKQQTGRDRS